MKKIVFVLSIYVFALLITSCGNKKQEDHTGAHTHQDGTVHGDSDHEEQVAPEQESFVVDSADVDDHEGHDHEHQH